MPQGDQQLSSNHVIVRNSAFNLLGMALIVPLNFLALFTLARRLGQQSLGIFFAIFAISAVIFLMSSVGVTTVLTRRIAQAPERLREIVAEAVGLWLVISAISVTALLVVCSAWSHWLLEKPLSWPLLVAASVAIVARHGLELAAAVARGIERFEFENLARVIQVGSFCMVVLLAVDAERNGSLVAFAGYALSNILGLAFLAVVLATRWNCRSFSLRFSSVKYWFSESWPVGAGDIFRQIGWQTEILMLSALQSPAAVGIYSVAYRPLQPLQILPRSLVSVTFPKMSRMATEDPASISSMVSESTLLLWMLSLPMAVSVTVCAQPLIRATAGTEFDAAALPLQLLIWLTGFTFINTQSRFVFSATGRERSYWALTCGVLLPKLLIAAICIPLFGIYGACFSCLAGEMMLAVAGLTVLYAAGLAVIPWLRLAKVCVAAIVMAVPLVVLIGQTDSLPVLVFACGGGTVLFFVSCLMLGVWSRVQFIALLQIFRRLLSRLGPKSKPDSNRQVAVDVSGSSGG